MALLLLLLFALALLLPVQVCATQGGVGGGVRLVPIERDWASESEKKDALFDVRRPGRLLEVEVGLEFSEGVLEPFL